MGIVISSWLPNQPPVGRICMGSFCRVPSGSYDLECQARAHGMKPKTLSLHRVLVGLDFYVACTAPPKRSMLPGETPVGLFRHADRGPWM